MSTQSNNAFLPKLYENRMTKTSGVLVTLMNDVKIFM